MLPPMSTVPNLKDSQQGCAAGVCCEIALFNVISQEDHRNPISKLQVSQHVWLRQKHYSVCAAAVISIRSRDENAELYWPVVMTSQRASISPGSPRSRQFPPLIR